MSNEEAEKMAIKIFKDKFVESDFDPEVLEAINVSTSYCRYVGVGCRIEDKLDKYCVCIVFSVYVNDEPINILTIIINKQTREHFIHHIIEKKDIPKSKDISCSKGAILT